MMTMMTMKEWIILLPKKSWNAIFYSLKAAVKTSININVFLTKVSFTLNQYLHLKEV